MDKQTTQQNNPAALVPRWLIFPLGNNMPETILIVDDEESVRNSLAGVMRDEGYKVVTAASTRWISDQKPLKVPE
jgi:PII-like signaling protein